MGDPMSRTPPPPRVTSTLWDFQSQRYGEGQQGDRRYVGVTPSYVIWNLVRRVTREGELVVDPMCGSGTTLDVCSDLKRCAVGFDLQPQRGDVQHGDARALPLGDNEAHLVFMDPPYSTHLKYSGDPRCLGEIEAGTPEWRKAMVEVLTESHRVLRPGGFMGVFVSDSYRAQATPHFVPIGFDVFELMRALFVPWDIVAVVRHHRSLRDETALEHAARNHYLLRGFNYLLLGRKAPFPEPQSPRARSEERGSGERGPRPRGPTSRDPKVRGPKVRGPKDRGPRGRTSR